MIRLFLPLALWIVFCGYVITDAISPSQCITDSECSCILDCLEQS